MLPFIWTLEVFLFSGVLFLCDYLNVFLLFLESDIFTCNDLVEVAVSAGYDFFPFSQTEPDISVMIFSLGYHTIMSA